MYSTALAAPYPFAHPYRRTLPAPDMMDTTLCLLFLVGIYLGIALPLPGGIPLPAVLAGVSGLLLLTKHMAELRTAHVLAVGSALAVAVISVLVSADVSLLGEKFKGFVQLTYSLLVAFGFFLVARHYTREKFATIFLALTLTILLGSAMETFIPAVKAASDSFRGMIFDSGVYSADRRDLALYGRVRPKFFTSEPSFIAFGYTLFAFCWYVVSRQAGKVVCYVGLLALGYFLIRGPTILLGITLVPIYEIFLASRRRTVAGNTRLDLSRAVVAAIATCLLVIIGFILGWEVLEPRIDGIVSGRDPSFFARILAPTLIARDVLTLYPFAGVGLTGWESLEQMIVQLYATTNHLAYDVQFDGASQSLTNYFWSLWIFMGLIGGLAFVVAMSFLLRSLGVPSLAFCWCVWIVFGQAAGGFVTPRTWVVLALAALISVLHEKRKRRPGNVPRRRVLPAEPHFALSPPTSTSPESGAPRLGAAVP